MKPRTAELVGYTKAILTLLGVGVVLALGLPITRLVIAALIYGGSGLWTGLIVFCGTYERDVERRPMNPQRSFRRSVLLLFLALFWLAGVARGLVERHWAEAFATFVLWWVGVLAASVIETIRQLRIERGRSAPTYPKPYD
jgi:hypothetical protein